MRRGPLLSPQGRNLVWGVAVLTALGFLLFALSGCASGPPIPAPPKEVVVEVIRPCIGSNVPEPGSYADDGIKAVADPVERMKRRSAANEQRKGRLAIVEPAIAGCR